nr:type II toxin-antitoxin system prevent-host-death family antitoxin [Aureimonas sp. Leaf454]
MREAKTGFSALVEAAERGEPTIVTKHGRAAAMIVPVEEGRKLFPQDNPSFADKARLPFGERRAFQAASPSAAGLASAAIFGPPLETPTRAGRRTRSPMA